MAASQFFRVATEGATTDGRTIDAQWIKDIVETYDPKTYTALVNCEHINGVAPDGPFGSYGAVTAVKAEPEQFNIGGKQVTRLALYAQIEANDNLVALNKAKQKLFSSIEVEPKFANTSKAYLLGIAVTDTPASLGTEMMKFCASQGAANPLAHRKKTPTSLFTATEEITGLFAAQTPALVPPAASDAAVIPGTDPLAWLKSVLGFSQQAAAPAAVTPPAAPVAPPAPATPPAPTFDPVAAAAFSAMLQQMEADRALTLAVQQGLTADRAAMVELRAQLAGQPANGFSHRPFATGADDGERADC